MCFILGLLTPKVCVLSFSPFEIFVEVIPGWFQVLLFESRLAENSTDLSCLVLLATAEWGGPPCTSGWVVTLLLSLNRITVECGGQPGPWAHQLSLSLNSGDAPMVGSLWDHKLTVRVDGMGLTLKPTNALLWLLINETSVGPAGHLPKVWQHHWGPTWVSVPNAYALICRRPSRKVHLVKEDFFAFNWELVPSEPKGCG